MDEVEAKYWRDTHVWKVIEKKGLTNREAWIFLDISPDTYEKLNPRKSDMEKEWLKKTIEMYMYYSVPQMETWLEGAIYIGSKIQNDWDELIKESTSSLSHSSPDMKSKGKLRAAIDEKIKISELAEKRYGIKVVKGKCVCPFHADSNPSLKFNDEWNSFYCFGCRAKGDIVNFYQRMEGQKNG